MHDITDVQVVDMDGFITDCAVLLRACHSYLNLKFGFVRIK